MTESNELKFGTAFYINSTLNNTNYINSVNSCTYITQLFGLCVLKEY